MFSYNKLIIFNNFHVWKLFPNKVVKKDLRGYLILMGIRYYQGIIFHYLKYNIQSMGENALILTGYMLKNLYMKYHEVCNFQIIQQNRENKYNKMIKVPGSRLWVYRCSLQKSLKFLWAWKFHNKKLETLIFKTKKESYWRTLNKKWYDLLFWGHLNK